MTPEEISLEIILDASAAAYGLSYMRLVGERDRSGPAADARILAYWLARRMTTRSYPQIGRALNRDHTTVISGERMAEQRRCIDPEFQLVSTTVLSTLMTLERVGVLAMAREASPVDVARRILSDPQRQAVGLPVHQIVALALAVAANAPTTTDEEADHGQN